MSDHRENITSFENFFGGGKTLNIESLLRNASKNSRFLNRKKRTPSTYIFTCMYVYFFMHKTQNGNAKSTNVYNGSIAGRPMFTLLYERPSELYCSALLYWHLCVCFILKKNVDVYYERIFHLVFPHILFISCKKSS